MYNNTDLKQYDDAIISADRLFNQSDKADFTYLDYRYYGKALSQTKKYDQAIEQYKKAIEADSSHVELWKDISDMYSSKNDYTNAVAAYNSYLNSLTEDKKTSDVYYDFGKLYYAYGNSTDSVSNGNTESVTLLRKNALIKADSIFGKVISLEPTNYRGYRLRALTNLSIDPEGIQGLAKQYYEQVLKIVEAKADARYNPVIIECSRYLGYYYSSKKDYAQSKVYWNKILSLDPTNEVATKAISILDKAQKAKK